MNIIIKYTRYRNVKWIETDRNVNFPGWESKSGEKAGKGNKSRFNCSKSLEISDDFQLFLILIYKSSLSATTI